MRKIVVSGYYGFNNIGDESILESVIENLRKRIDNIEITVLSKTPQMTSKKYNVRAIERMDFKEIYKTIKRCDLLISGGGSLLQDVTSRKTILYYLMIIVIGIIHRKKVFVYSQGIGPIQYKLNKVLVRSILNKVDFIDVRDESSKDLLLEIGVSKTPIYVTADPVIRLKKGDTHIGEKILEIEGLKIKKDSIKIGIALRGLNNTEKLRNEICETVELLIKQYDAQIVFIPFHYNEDLPMIYDIKNTLGDKAVYLTGKYLADEMLGVVGNLDILVGVRLHALIHAAIMEVPMIAISYDPKIDAFMKSLDMDVLCDIKDIKGEWLVEAVSEVYEGRQLYKEKIKNNVDKLVEKLSMNEILINKLLQED